jgi:hypothetical protein
LFSNFHFVNNSFVIFACFSGGVTGKTAVTHLPRSTVVCNNTEAGVPHIETRVHQGWEHTTATDVYLRGSYHPSAMFPAVGWESLRHYYCWWESDGTDIPKELLFTVFGGYRFGLSPVTLEWILSFAEQVGASGPPTTGPSEKYL